MLLSRLPPWSWLNALTQYRSFSINKLELLMAQESVVPSLALLIRADLPRRSGKPSPPSISYPIQSAHCSSSSSQTIFVFERGDILRTCLTIFRDRNVSKRSSTIYICSIAAVTWEQLTCSHGQKPKSFFHSSHTYFVSFGDISDSDAFIVFYDLRHYYRFFKMLQHSNGILGGIEGEEKQWAQISSDFSSYNMFHCSKLLELH